MFDRQSLHISMLLWGCIFSLIAMLCMFMSKNFNKKKRLWLLSMLFSCAVLLLSDALAWGFRGIPGITASIFVHASNFLVFLFSDILLFLYHGYVCCNLFADYRNFIFKPSSIRVNNDSDHISFPMHRIRTVYILAILGSILVIISQFTNFYYYFDINNIYHRNTFYAISLIIPLLGMIIDLSLLIQYRQKLSRLVFVSMLSYSILPFVSMIIQLFYYGISLINIAISISMIVMFLVAIVEQNNNLAKKEREAADLQISLMLSQIAPHFIFNTLTTIQSLCETNPSLAKQTTRDFATYLRGNIDSLNKKTPIPFEQEINHVQSYLAIEKRRFGDRINVVYDIETKNFRIPALTVQPMVENAVKHGLCRKPEGGTIYIMTRVFDNMIQVTVQDDGAGFDQHKLLSDGRNHVGLKNVESRLSSMCHGTLSIRSKVGKGTTVVIMIPR